MKLAVLSDIHSNYYALKTCLDWIDENEMDGIVFLGDYVSDCAFPQKTMELLYKTRQKYKTWFVRGNREASMIEGNMAPNLESLRYTYENLSKEDIAFFKTMPIAAEVRIDGYPLLSISHGDYHNDRENIRPENDAMKRLLFEMNGTLHLCGHTHNSFIYEKDGKTIANPGSAGVPQDGSPEAGMAVIESDGNSWKVVLMKLAYDVEKTVEAIHTSGLFARANTFARCIIATIRTGTDYKKKCLDLAMEYKKECDNQLSEIELWKKAADQLGI